MRNAGPSTTAPEEVTTAPGAKVSSRPRPTGRMLRAMHRHKRRHGQPRGQTEKQKPLPSLLPGAPNQ